MEPTTKVEETTKKELQLDDGRIESVEEFKSPEELYDELIERIHRYHPDQNITLIKKAYQLAQDAHKNQVRKSGEPYIIHPICVAIILADLEMDQETIAAGLLHDVVEDTIFTTEEIEAMFGEDVALLVDGVTKLSQIQYNGDKLDVQAENLRKMFLAMAKDIRVIIIKLADRLHNMRTLKHMKPEKQQEKARETLDIYAPIAQRLGISRIKVELDDLSLKYLEPEVYYDLVKRIAARKSEREQYVQQIVEEVSEHIQNANIEAQIDGRVKHFFSIYKKMKNQNKSIDQIYDLFAVRIIVGSIKDCYAALGVIHEMYKPVPGRFKDYISMPKGNLYQSLHTTLIGKTGQPFEIQIRTYEMHRTAEYGIAAHWKYKANADGKKVSDAEEEKLSWLRQILEWQQNTADNHEFMDLLKSDLNLFSDFVYCFTPGGDVKSLPAGSTPVDFAYNVHSTIGNTMVGARVNGKLVPIEHQLQNGDKVEIITSKNAKGPSRDWLNIVKSTQAKNKINQWFKHEFKDENIVKGKDMLQEYCKAKGVDMTSILRPDYMEVAMKKYGFKDWESVLAAIGHGALKEGQIVNHMQSMYDKEHPHITTDEEIIQEIEDNQAAKEQAAKSHHTKMRPPSGIVVEGTDDVAVRFSKCCSPVPGDEIVGFVTRGRGVSIHRLDCVNILNLPAEEKSRLIVAEWQQSVLEGVEKYVAEIIIYANNRNGLLADVAKALTEKNIDIISMNTKTSKQGIATMAVSFEIGGRDELKRVIDKLGNVPSVIDIERTSG